MAGPEKVLINLMTQEPAPNNRTDPGKASVQNVAHALKELRGLIEKEDIRSVALPKLTNGVGGLAWSEVEPHLGDLKIPVIVYETYEKGSAATEKLSWRLRRLG